MPIECKKCPYFVKQKDKIHKGSVVLGFCKLRQKHISDMTINQPMCKDRAVIL
jgi:hypothetical protein